MNIKTADRLCTLRKEHNLSQEELAAKLGVSRQAVSKWERSEASPDTDNLIELAHIYGVTLDELLNGDEAVELIEENKGSVDVQESAFHWSDDGYDVTIDGDKITVITDGQENTYSKKEIEKKEHRMHTVKAIVNASYVALAAVAYVLIGFILGDWVNYYFLFILIPVVASLVEAIYQRRMKAFAFPVLLAAIYCAVSQPTGLWHPLWVIFILTPVYYAIATPVDKIRRTDDYEAIDDALDEFKESKRK